MLLELLLENAWKNMTEVISFLHHSLSSMKMGEVAGNENIQRTASEPVMERTWSSSIVISRKSSSPTLLTNGTNAPHSALKGKRGPRAARPSVRFNDQQDGKSAKDHNDLSIAKNTDHNSSRAKNDFVSCNARDKECRISEAVNEFDKLVRLLDKAERKTFQESLIQKRFAPGETIIQAGSRGNSIFFIGSGTCWQLGFDGRSSELCAGEYFGDREAVKAIQEQNILDSILKLQHERKDNVIAGQAGCVAYECPGDSFASLFGTKTEAISMIQARSQSRSKSIYVKLGYQQLVVL